MAMPFLGNILALLFPRIINQINGLQINLATSPGMGSWTQGIVLLLLILQKITGFDLES